MHALERLKTGKYIGVNVDIGLYNEYVRRSKDHNANVSAQIEVMLANFLEENDQEDITWNLDGCSSLLQEGRDEQIKRCGSPREGYQWQLLFLPNGTRLMAKYKGEQQFAEVRFSKIVDDDGKYTPSEWASKVANNTVRNAWREIWVHDPSTGKYQLADMLRKKQG